MTDPALIRRQAADWFVAIHTATDPSPELVQQWLDWLDASKENQTAFEDVGRIWHSTTPAIIAHQPMWPDELDYDGSVSIADWRAQRSKHVRPPQVSMRQRWGHARRAIWQGLAAAAVVSAVTFGGRDLFERGAEHVRDAAETFQTGTGEHLDLILADGSRVALGARSQLTIMYTARARHVRLDTGEAFFSVQKDAKRPFKVWALDGSITAVGTAFDVRSVADLVTVTVREGVVRVEEGEPTSARSSNRKNPAPHVVQVARGERTLYGSDSSDAQGRVLPVVMELDPNEAGRWRNGWLVYRDETLKEVVADLARYSNLKIEVVDSASELRFSGAVFKDRIDEWLVALPNVSPVLVQRNADHVVISIDEHSTTAKR